MAAATATRPTFQSWIVLDVISVVQAIQLKAEAASLRQDASALNAYADAMLAPLWARGGCTHTTRKDDRS